MLGLPNIFLIAPPASSFYQQHPQPISSSPQLGTNPVSNDQCNIISGSNQESWVAFKRYQQHQESSFDARKELGGGGGYGGDDDDNNNNDNNTGSTRACRDCGNRAKKECEYRRCRTCCKSRGYDCATHVKSTWVSAAKRREKHGGGGGGASSGSSSAAGGGGFCGAKRPRENIAATSNSTSNNNAAASFSFDTGSSYQDASFKESLPGQVRAPAVFRCIRVSTVNGGRESEIVYQAMVNISGHVFKGFLYDQGIDEKNVYPCISKVQSSGRNRGSTSSTFGDPPDAYAAPRLLEGNG